MITEKKYLIKTGERRDMSLFGAFPNEGIIRFELHFTDEETPSSVTMKIHSDGLADGGHEEYRDYEFSLDFGVYFAEIQADELSSLTKNGLLFYRYFVTVSSCTYTLGGEEVERLLGSEEYGERQLLIYDKDFKTPDFIKGGEIYHIFVDRFATSGKYPVKEGAKLNPDWENGIPEYAPYRGAPVKNNDFFGGDLTGAAEKIEHIASLGVTTVYLSPVFESVSNHKYDTGDYMKVDSMFGGDGALKYFIEKCAERGISVILDGVFNHTGDDSVYFDRYHKYTNGAYYDKDSPYFGWYNFYDYPEEYECWWGIKILPRVDCSNSSFREYILGDGGVVEKYMRMGAAGFRLDVADELSDVFLDEFRRKVKSEREDSIVLGEVWEDASRKISYSDRRRYLTGRQLDSVMNYPLRGGVIAFIKYGEHEILKTALETVYRHYPKGVSDSLMNFLGTHDTERIITVLAGEPDDGKSHDELSRMRLSERERMIGRSLVKCAWSIVATSYGVPSIFYGDETGLEGYHDPFCRMPYPWGHEDEELLGFYKRMGAFRKGEPLFKEGLFRVVYSNENVFVTKRFDGERELYTVVTRGESFEFDAPDAVCVFDSDIPDAEKIDDPFVVPPYTARIFAK